MKMLIYLGSEYCHRKYIRELGSNLLCTSNQPHPRKDCELCRSVCMKASRPLDMMITLDSLRTLAEASAFNILFVSEASTTEICSSFQFHDEGWLLLELT